MDVPSDVRASRVRYRILALVFIATCINYADRATLSIAAPSASRELGLDAVAMGYVFSAFGWAYVIGQIPGGWLLDRFGTRLVYAASLLLWSIFTLLQGFVGLAAASTAIVALFALRFLFGVAQAPSFPGNARIVAAWFPTAERGTAVAVFNSAQYFATVLFAPLMGWLTYAFGWRYVFYVMGGISLLFVLVWMKVLRDPEDHPSVTGGELDLMRTGGALLTMGKSAAGPVGGERTWEYIRQLLTNRMLLGVYIAQYCITAMTYFFLTWFPVYLVQGRGISILNAGFIATLPAICGFIGGVLGGMFSDHLLRRGCSLTVARKTPILLGMLLSTVIVACNYVDAEWMVVAFMALAFFGKGIGSLGWAVVSDTSPREIGGLSGGLFNTFGNVAAITTPIIIGYIVGHTGSFNGALAFVGANALVAVISYVLIVGEIKRVELEPARLHGYHAH